MRSSRKKNSKRTDTTSSRTPSVEPAIDGLGGTSPSQKQGLQGDYIDASRAIAQMYQTRKRELITSNQLLAPCTASKGGMGFRCDSCVPCLDFRSSAALATQQRPEPKTSNGKLSDKNESVMQTLATIHHERLKNDPEYKKSYMAACESHAYVKPITKGLKHDSEKPMLAYIPKAALDAEGKAFGYGARKYEAWNYRNGIAVSRTVSAALRHIAQFLDGEDIDQESGAHHLGSARANLAMALDTLANHPSLDDRFKGEKK